jgi:hypothetical protein
MRVVTARYPGTCPRCLGQWAAGAPLTFTDERWVHSRCDASGLADCYFCHRPTGREQYRSPQGWLVHWACAWEEPDRLEDLVKTCQDLSTPATRRRPNYDCFALVGCVAPTSRACPVIPGWAPRKW